MPATSFTLMAPRKPQERLCYMNGALAVLDHLQHLPRTVVQQHDFNLIRREVLDARQELLDNPTGR